jgi:hypothetical protein
MSHDATNWAIKQRGLKPTTKIVLWHLCDRFNPDYGCFPSQARLAHDCEISRSTLNDHLRQLEAGGLLRRVPRIDPVTKRQLPTRYILGFERGFTPRDVVPSPEIGHGVKGAAETIDDTGTCGLDEPDAVYPCPDFGHGIDAKAVSGFRPDPCPENGQSRVRNPDTNLVREPLSKSVKEEEDAAAREAVFDLFLAELLSARRWIDDLGLSESRIIEVATETRRDHPNPPDGPKALDRFMERAAGRDEQNAVNSLKAKRSSKAQSEPQSSPDELAAFYAAKVNSNEYLPQNMISAAMCGLMLERGLVTPERLRMRGVL